MAAQNFEYKVSSILDKTTESMFGYISVLVGSSSTPLYFLSYMLLSARSLFRISVGFLDDVVYHNLNRAGE